LGVPILATGEVAQARAIRAAGIELPIVLFAGAAPDELPALAREGFIPTITDLAGAKILSSAGLGAAPVYIKVDVGLGRLGIPLDEAQEAILRIKDLPGLSLEGLYTHASFNDEAGKAWAAGRLRAFDDLLDALSRRELVFPVTQARASSCVLAGLTDNCNSVCVGHALYGLAPIQANRSIHDDAPHSSHDPWTRRRYRHRRSVQDRPGEANRRSADRTGLRLQSTAARLWRVRAG
jgi:alanine racemase